MNISIDEYVDYVKSGEVPPAPANECNRWEMNSEFVLKCYTYRENCTKRGMWPKIDMLLLQELANTIGKQSVLEVMAGAGFIGKGLNSLGVDITCTDNYGWNRTHKWMKRVYPIRRFRADHAVRKLGRKYDILLVSWPPYGCEEVIKMMNYWDCSKPIIYIGEFEGCNAPDEFTDRLTVIKEFNLQVWDGLHDTAVIATYQN